MGKIIDNKNGTFTQTIEYRGNEAEADAFVIGLNNGLGESLISLNSCMASDSDESDRKIDWEITITFTRERDALVALIQGLMDVMKKIINGNPDYRVLASDAWWVVIDSGLVIRELKNKIHNNNCDGEYCTEEDAEVRGLPIDGNSNDILCRSCFKHEIEWRKHYLVDPDLPTWESLKIYGGLATERRKLDKAVPI